ncbi:hypothetical protein DL89DRAFT_265358 [Linderina pennispora]|uniref:Uncharacterized protein n=1 Tax=Linderina pennispora TaxID=61395 RepID=A0A1Y1WI20_9FUNG|nr:uncharacterized protein DL89DRAFT_265358 [Linderina pennispora]ORX73221.1 hypothetical protein DL89DRAFT_265358 [Linderina pennispora]
MPTRRPPQHHSRGWYVQLEWEKETQLSGKEVENGCRHNVCHNTFTHLCFPVGRKLLPLWKLHTKAKYHIINPQR